MFGQTFEFHDLAIVALLVVLEGVLSIDNALVLGLLAKPLPHDEQKKALTYGLIGAFAFRFICIAMAAYLLQWRIVKLLGGGYLVYVSLKHFFFGEKHSDASTVKSRVNGFWPTVAAIELTDIAFAVDSIVAAIGVVGPGPGNGQRHPKLWVVLIGGFIGVVLMRFAAVMFIKLLEKFPRFETAAYLLVLIIGCKLLADWGFNSDEHPHRVNFHDWHNPAFWIFWGLMLASLCLGFIPSRKNKPAQ